MGSMPQYLRNSERDFRNATPTKLKADMNSAQKIRQAFRIGDRQLVGIAGAVSINRQVSSEAYRFRSFWADFKARMLNW